MGPGKRWCAALVGAVLLSGCSSPDQPEDKTLKGADAKIETIKRDGDVLKVRIFEQDMWDGSDVVMDVLSALKPIAERIQDGAPEGVGAQRLQVIVKVKTIDRLGNEGTQDTFALNFPMSDILAAKWENLQDDQQLNLADDVLVTPLGQKEVGTWCQKNRSLTENFCDRVEQVMPSYAVDDIDTAPVQATANSTDAPPAPPPEPQASMMASASVAEATQAVAVAAASSEPAPSGQPSTLSPFQQEGAPAAPTDAPSQGDGAVRGLLADFERYESGCRNLTGPAEGQACASRDLAGRRLNAAGYCYDASRNPDWQFCGVRR